MNQILLERPNCPMPQQGAVAWSYRQQQVQSAGPLQSILLVYDAAIMACKRGDFVLALEALSVLRGALDFARGGEIAVQLQTLYLYCEEKVRRRKFDEPGRILRELREAWSQCVATPAGSSAGHVALNT